MSRYFRQFSPYTVRTDVRIAGGCSRRAPARRSREEVAHFRPHPGIGHRCHWFDSRSFRMYGSTGLSSALFTVTKRSPLPLLDMQVTSACRSYFQTSCLRAWPTRPVFASIAHTVSALFRVWWSATSTLLLFHDQLSTWLGHFVFTLAVH